MHGLLSNNGNCQIEVQGYAMLIFLTFDIFRTKVSLFESVICLVQTKLWKFLEARMLYGILKCIEN